eukprot:5174604-Prymnesium_polylepis.1
MRGRRASRRGSYVNVASRRVRDMFEAVLGGKLGKVSQLLEGGVAIDSLDDDSNTPLNCAAEGDVLVVEELLRHKPDVNAQNKNGVTPLMRAVRSGHADVVQRLVQAGADLQIKNNDGHTAVELATEGGNAAICKLVGIEPSKTKVNIAASQKEQDSPTTLAARRRGSLPAIHGASRQLRGFFDAVSEGDMARVDRLIGLKMVDPANSFDDDGNSPLFFAAEGEVRAHACVRALGLRVGTPRGHGRWVVRAAVLAAWADQAAAGSRVRRRPPEPDGDERADGGGAVRRRGVRRDAAE